MDNVISHRAGRAGVITLNRPETLNALTLGMIRDLTKALAAHVCDPAVELVLLTSSSAKALCAGGDMRRIRELSLAGAGDEAYAFFEEEYDLIRAIATCPKPYIALIDGIAMGGGLGLSVHGRYCIVTEKALLAMPETAIGFFPDVGGTFFLPRLPAGAGHWLGLTGARLKGAEAVAAGMATHHVASAELPALVQALQAGHGTVAAVIDTAARPADTSAFEARMAKQGRWFAQATLPAIVQALAAAAPTQPEAAESLAHLRSLSPAALAWSLQLMHQGAAMDLDHALRQELAFTREVIGHADFIEGVRAVLVDKDRQPKWANALPS